ncbi:aldo/keto reductase, partial [Paenibacillus sepulcri]|nr:aldo/keto reductase [Paenibacillus sepulcri]
ERTTFEEAMNGTVAAFLKLKEEGKVRAIGVNAGKPELLLPFIATGKIDMVQNYGRYMLIDFSSKDTLHPFAREHGVGIINGSVLGMGLLADSPAPFLQGRELLEEAERRKAHLDFLRRPGPKGLIEPAMRFSLTCPDIAVTLTGTSSVQSLLKNISYCDGQGLPEAELARLYELFGGLPPVFG